VAALFVVGGALVIGDAVLLLILWVALSFGFFLLIPVAAFVYLRWRRRQEGRW
jgi:hypothetical protein